MGDYPDVLYLFIWPCTCDLVMFWSFLYRWDFFFFPNEWLWEMSLDCCPSHIVRSYETSFSSASVRVFAEPLFFSEMPVFFTTDLWSSCHRCLFHSDIMLHRQSKARLLGSRCLFRAVNASGVSKDRLHHQFHYYYLRVHANQPGATVVLLTAIMINYLWLTDELLELCSDDNGFGLLSPFVWCLHVH